MKPDERAFLEECLQRCERETFNNFVVVRPRDLINEGRINHKRAWYLLDKWSRRGLYDYGVNLDLGWFDEAKARAYLGDPKDSA